MLYWPKLAKSTDAILRYIFEPDADLANITYIKPKALWYDSVFTVTSQRSSSLREAIGFYRNIKNATNCNLLQQRSVLR